jgi:hypothetical protein
MGRKPIGEKPMTAAERQQKRRAAMPKPVDRLAEIERRLAQLEAEVAKLKKIRKRDVS